ncbi:sterigmatocystin biosynthesis lipase esterase STCI [Fusarium albosuccineum]|uniref:Sterigmatocystin biosynthesis lipase esterase STCI n=1 Tax=Fusarium albosuccineum TaxID=1237068 RepID=A0A8H4P0Y6_9HYPO|nr:sterigmatocystin biosynthesis lipase esterase STCI [Fusarium albosuccineum]
MLTVEETRALGNIPPELQPLLQHNPMLQAWNMDTDIHAMRALMAQIRESKPKPDPETLSYQTEDFQIPLRDGFKVDARVYRPKSSSSEGRPGLIVFHGGGFMMGDLETEAPLCVQFTSLGGIAVNIDFRHAPEHVFPRAVHDAFDATVWTSQNVDKLGIDPAKGLLIGGSSSGADMCIAVSHLCRDSNMTPPLTGVYAPITSAVSDATVPEKYKDHFFSKEQHADAPLFNTESLKFVHSQYKPDQESPLAFPIAFPSHVGIPKTYFQACGLDPVRDCSLVLEQVYKDEGVPTKMDIYPGLPHAFWAIFPELDESKKREQDSLEGLKWLLAQ